MIVGALVAAVAAYALSSALLPSTATEPMPTARAAYVPTFTASPGNQPIVTAVVVNADLARPINASPATPTALPINLNGSTNTSALARPTALPALGALIDPIAVANRAPEVLPSPMPVSAGAQLGAYCGSFGYDDPHSLAIYNWATRQTISLSGAWLVDLPLAWDASGSIFRGYGGSGSIFEEPNDVRIVWRLTLMMADNVERWIDLAESATVTDRYFVYAYRDTVPTTDRNGDHFGLHGCRAFTIPRGTLDYLLEAARGYQEFAGAYPNFLQPTDPRWRAMLLTPIESIVNLRAQPEVYNNDPVYTVREQTRVWVVQDPAWGDWAQVKLGNTLAWVHTGFARLTPSA